MLLRLTSRLRRGLAIVLTCAGLAACAPVEPVSKDEFTFQAGRTYGVLEVIGQTDVVVGYLVIFCPTYDNHIGMVMSGNCTSAPDTDATPWAILNSWPIYESEGRRFIVNEFYRSGLNSTFVTGPGPVEYGFLVARIGASAAYERELALMPLTPGKVHVLGKIDLNRFGFGQNPVQIVNDPDIETAFRAAFPNIDPSLVVSPPIGRVPADCVESSSFFGGKALNCALQRN